MADESRRWVIQGPAEQGLDRANWTHAQLADPLKKVPSRSARRSALPRFCPKFGIRPDRPTSRSRRGDPVEPAEAAEERAERRTKAEAGELVRLGPEEGRFPRVPTRGATLGLKGQRPRVGPRDGTERLSVFAVVKVVRAALPSNLLASPARAQQTTGPSPTRRMPEAFAAPRRHIAWLDPAERPKRVVLLLGNAPGPRGRPLAEAWADHRHLEFSRLPSSSPPLHVIERFWRVLRRRTTPQRLFDRRADLQRSISIRSSLG